MNRAIKFRCFYDGEYHYSDDKIGDGHEKVAALMNDFNGCELEQYTGLKDKSGREIFEGDIISTPTATGYKNWEVKHDGCAFYLSAVNSSASLSYYSKLSKIIGNIHENQELIGVKG